MKLNKKILKRVLIILGSFFLAALIGIASIYLYIRHMIYQPSRPVIDNSTASQDSTTTTPDEPYKEQKGIINILLIGTDARELDEQARSDSMMILTIDTNKKNVRLTSIVRDTYVDILNHSTQKINAAFAFGGPELLMDTIQRNFKIKLDSYVIINFWGFENLIDSIDGLDIEVKDSEVEEINKFIGEYDNVKSPLLTKGGMLHLDGQQTLAYARIRHVGNGVYERDSRQRIVVSQIFNKLKDTSILNYPSVLSKLLPCVKTNIEPALILNYAYTVSKFKPLEFQQMELPIEDLSDGRIYKGSWVLLMDKEQNAKVLSNFIFNGNLPTNKDYDINAFKTVLNNYLNEEKKENPTVNQNDPEIKKEPEKSDHSYP